jgi:hypothetical protein
MDKSENVGTRPGDAERPHESGAAAPGRGGRMSRQRKTAAVLRLLRGEDLELVSRSLGVKAATLTAWRDASSPPVRRRSRQNPPRAKIWKAIGGRPGSERR